MISTRKLAAIMFTDIVGYSALMGKSETKAYQLLKKNRRVQKPLIEKYGGKWLKEMGDGVLASFSTVSDAVYCAIDIQRACKEEIDLKLRIGIHQGEVIAEDGDLFGEGVNIASRIEPLAPSGGIYVSESVFRNIENKEGIVVDFVREETLKNIKHPVRIYKVDLERSAIFDAIEDIPSKSKTRVLQWRTPVLFAFLILILLVSAYLIYDRTVNDESEIDQTSFQAIEISIAVLPFKNLSQNQENQYFADGIMEGIENNLSKIQDLRVASRSSAEKYREKLPSAQDIAKDLNVDYLLEASVFKSDNRVRITTQLINADKDEHVWSEQYDRDLNDVFIVMSEISIEVASEIEATILPETRSRINYIPTKNIEAYELYLQATKERLFEDKIRLLDSAISIDPYFDLAYAYRGAQWLYGAGGYIGSYSLHEILSNATVNINRALEINPDNFTARQNLGFMQLWYFWNFQEAEKQFNMAMQLNPSGFSDGHMYVLLASGKFENAVSYGKKALEVDPSSWWLKSLLSLCQSYLKQSNEVQNNAEYVLKMTDNNSVYINTIRAFLYTDQYVSLISISKRYFELYPEPNFRSPIVLAYMSIAYFKTGDVDMAQELLEEIIEKREEVWAGSPSYFISQVYAQMGEIDLAFDWLGKGYEDHEIEMYWLKVDPPFEPLHSDPRWQQMLNKVGFPE